MIERILQVTENSVSLYLATRHPYVIRSGSLLRTHLPRLWLWRRFCAESRLTRDKRNRTNENKKKRTTFSPLICQPVLGPKEAVQYFTLYCRSALARFRPCSLSLSLSSDHHVPLTKQTLCSIFFLLARRPAARAAGGRRPNAIHAPQTHA